MARCCLGVLDGDMAMTISLTILYDDYEGKRLCSVSVPDWERLRLVILDDDINEPIPGDSAHYTRIPGTWGRCEIQRFMESDTCVRH